MNIPFSEMLKSIPGSVGIRLEEELPFKEMKKMGELEIRHYEPFTLAQLKARGDMDFASEACFRSLAEFIFGKNEQNEKTGMTVPVFYDHQGDEWIMSFYLGEDAKHLRPIDKQIEIRERPAKDVAVLRFSGNFTEEKMEESKSELLRLVKEAGLKAASHVWWAQFDQPVSLPMTKRNEVLVCIEGSLH